MRATNFGALADVPGSGYFERSAKRRAIVLLTDGESASFDANAVAQGVRREPADEPPDGAVLAPQRVDLRPVRTDATRTTGPTPRSKAQLASLATATHGSVFERTGARQRRASLQTMLGSGPTKGEGRTRTTHPLAPYVAVLALVPLALIFRNQVRGRVRGERTWSRSGNYVPLKVPFMPPAAWPGTVHL